MGSKEDVAFKSLEDCFDIIGCYKDVDQIQAVADFEKHLSIIAIHHAKNGLTKEQLEFLIPLTFVKNLKSSTVTLLIQCLIPKQMIPKHLVSNVALYVLSFHHTLQPHITVALLKWLIGILEYELTDVSAVDDVYCLFYFLLENETYNIQKYAIWIIYMLTRPEDVTESRISFINKFEFKYGRKKETQALLSLFKCYQPERVPASVPVMRMLDIPQYLPSEVMKEGLMNAQIRNAESGEDNNEVFCMNRKPFIKLFKFDYLSPKYTKNIVQVPEYENIGGKRASRITDVESVVEIEDCLPHLELPSNVISLLAKETGLHLLAYGDETLQLRFAYKLNDVLIKVFVKRERNASNLEKELLLERLYELQEYMKQGLFVVSRFLASYLEFWNGVHHRNQILKLIRWVTFSSYAELEESILLPLYDLFVTSEVDFMCEIISALSGLLLNMFQVDYYRNSNNFKPLFLKATPGWITEDAGRVLGGVIRTIRHFITVGHVLKPESLRLLHESISFHELLLELETRSNFADLTIVQFSIVYRSLFSPCSTPFTRVCRLLLRYPTAINDIEVNATSKNLDRELKLVEAYCADIMNCLWFKKAVSNREIGIIFKDVRESVLKNLNQIVKVNLAFSLERHVMFLPFLVSVIESDHSLSFTQLMTRESIQAILENCLKDVVAFIKNQSH